MLEYLLRNDNVHQDDKTQKAAGIESLGAIVSRILKYANRPWDCLGLPAYTPAEHTRRHYRQLSLLIHPDKCDHPRAQEAMAILNNAFKKVTR